jgi:GAF domain-containing protein/nitrogen-specific signal transduction histidine kinase
VLNYARRVTQLDPTEYHVLVTRAPSLRSLLENGELQLLTDMPKVIREMLPHRLAGMSKTLQKMVGFSRVFGVRLQFEGQTYGLMFVSCADDWSPAEMRPLIDLFAAQVQAALDRTLRFESTQTRLAARLDELTRLAQVGEQMQVRLPLDSLLDTISRAVREVLGWDRVTIWLRDERTRILRPAAMQAVAAEASAPAPGLNEALSLDEAAWRRREYRISRSYFLPLSEAVFNWQVADTLILPLVIDEQTVGAIQVDQPAGGPRPSADDLLALELFAGQSAVAIENALLFERASTRLKQRTDELNALTALSDIADQGHMTATLERALEKVLGVSGLDAAAVALLDPPTGQLLPSARYGLPDVLWNEMLSQPMYIGDGVAGRALMTGRVITITNIAADPRVQYRDKIQQEGMQMIAGIGLIGRNPVGAMTLFARSAAPLAEETLAWLAVAGRQIALSVENTRLLESTRRRQRMAEAIREVSTAVASSLELDGVLSTILELFGRVVPFDTASILLMEADALRVKAVHGLDDPNALLGYTFPRDGRNLNWQAVHSRQVQVVSDVTKNENWIPLAPFAHIRAWISAPLIVHDEVIGLITLDHQTPGFYTDEDGRNVALIAQQAAAAIDNARRFQMERDRSGRLALLNDLGREFSMALDRDTTLSLVVERVVGRFGYSDADVFLVDPVSNELIWSQHAGSPLEEAATASLRRPMRVGIVGHVAETGRTYLSGDVSRDPYYIDSSYPGTQSEIAVPLRIEDRIIGVLNVESDRLNAFDSDDVAMLETLAGQIGAALSMTALYQETQQRAGRMSTLFAASHELGSSLDSDQVLGRLAQWLVSAADATSARVYAWDLQAGGGRLVAQYVGGRANAVERQSMIGVTQRLVELPELVVQMQSRQPAVYTAETRHVDGALRESLRLSEVNSALFLPLIVRERLIGCVEVWETERVRIWQPDEIHMCQTIANVAASAIDNARLFEVERQRRAVAETVRELAAFVSSSLELQPILEALLDHAAELIPYDSASVLIAEADGLQVTASRGLPEAYRSSVIRIPANPLIESVFRSQQAQIQPDVRGVPGWSTLPGADYIRGWLGTPLKTKGRVIGLLTFDSRTPERYRREHADIAETIAYHASVAIENARLYQETRLHLRELETLRVVSLEMIQSLDAARVAQAIADGALRLLNATAVHLFSFDPESDTLERVVTLAAPGFEEIGQATPRREGLTMQVAHTGQAVVINDPENDPVYADKTRAWGAHAIVALPLQVRERVLGVMNVLFHTPHVIDDNDVRILGLLADQAATALENARLFQDEQQRRIAADVLREMSAVLTSTLNLDEVFEKLFDQLARVVPYTSTSVLFLEGSDHLSIVAGRGFEHPEHVIGRVFDAGQSTLSGQIIRERRPIIVVDVQALDNWPVFSGMEYIHGWMGAPLIARDQIIGTLAVDHMQPGVYRQEQADLLGAIANQAAAAIANARLYEQALERERFASALGRVSLAITSTLELNVVLEQICRESADAFGVDNGFVWLVEGAELVGFAGYGPGREPFVGLRVRLDDVGVLEARVLKQRRGEFVSQARNSDRVNRDLIERLGVASVLAGPLFNGDAPIGTLVIADSTYPDRFAADDIDRAEVLASHAAIAIENARLFQAEQRRARQLALVNRVGLDIASILDLDQLAQRVVDEIRSAFGYYFVGITTVDGGLMTWRAGAGGSEPGLLLGGPQQSIAEGIAGAAARSGEMVLARDVRLDPRYLPGPRVQRTLSEVALPLIAKGIVIGVLDVQSDRINAFGTEDLDVLMPLVSQLSVALENAQLYQALARHAASLETRVAERTAEIRREQERTTTILNSVADAVLVTDLTGAIILTNPVAETVLRQDDLDETPDRLRRWLRELTPDSGSEKIDLGGRTLQAAVAYINEENWPVGHVIVLRDITRLEEVDRLKTQFVTNVSHELRTPLTNIKLYLGLFQKGKPEKREQYLATLETEVNRLERLISDLLDLSRLERNDHALKHETIDLVDVLRHVVTTLEPQAEAKRQLLRFDTRCSMLKLPADRNQMIQVFVNLTANAINYTPAGGSVTLKVATTERDGRNWAVVSVSDTGIGISPEDQTHIFDRFYRGRAEHFHVGGTGLGLSIVKEIIDQHAGQISVESQIGQGSTFTIWLPLS